MVFCMILLISLCLFVLGFFGGFAGMKIYEDCTKKFYCAFCDREHTVRHMHTHTICKECHRIYYS